MRAAIELRKKLKSIPKVAEHLGVTDQTVRNYLGYEGVPDQLKEMVDRRAISATTAMSIARSVPDEKKAVEIAKKVKEVPSSARRRNIIDVARENPDRSASEVMEIAKKLKFTRITLDLTPRISQALETACRDYRHEPKDIANSALEEWLGKRGFLK
jgi:predicted transcriptional regulator